MQTSEPTDGLHENVHGDEEIQWVVRASGLARFASEGLGAAVAGLFGAAIVGVAVFSVGGAVLGPVAVPAAIGVAVVILALTVRNSLARFFLGTTEYAATDARLLTYEGYFGRELSSVPLAGVQDAEFDISGTERLFDVGTVTVDTERGYESMSFPYTPSPEAFAREVTSLASDARLRDASRHPTGEYVPGEKVVTDEPAHGLEKNVYPDEELLWVTTPNKRLRLQRALPGILFGALFVGILVGGFAFVVGMAAEGEGTATLAGVVVGGGVTLLFLVANAVPYLRGSTQYAATDRRIFEYDGRFGRSLSSVTLAGVQDAEYSVSFVESLLGFGSVTLDTDRGYERMTLTGVEKPAAVATEISRLATSDLPMREATHPSTVSAGEGIESASPSADLDSNLASNERVTWVIGPDKSARLLTNLVTSAPGIGVVGLILGGILGGVIYGSTSDLALAVLAVVGAVVGLFVLAAASAATDFLFDTTEYALTDDRLIEYSGTFGRELSSVPLAGIQDAEYDVSLVESFFDVGDVTVDTDPDYDSFRLEAVASPTAVAREVSELANAYRVAATRGTGTARDATGRAPAAGGDPAGPAGAGTTREVPPASAHKQCRDCRERIDVAASYCPACGADQPEPDRDATAACRQCDGPVALDDEFCRFCGARRPASGAA